MTTTAAGVDLNKLNDRQKAHMKTLQMQNVARASAYKSRRWGGVLTFVGLGLVSVSIYCYTMYAMRQEEFLDDTKSPYIAVGDNDVDVKNK